jgi:hypothetical protein
MLLSFKVECLHKLFCIYSNFVSSSIINSSSHLLISLANTYYREKEECFRKVSHGHRGWNLKPHRTTSQKPNVIFLLDFNIAWEQ